MLSPRPMCSWDLNMAVGTTLFKECFFGTSTTIDEQISFVLLY